MIKINKAKMCGATTWLLVVTFFSLDLLQYVEPAQLRCFIGTQENYLSVPLNKAKDLIGSPCIRLELPTVVYTFGYRGKMHGPATTAVVGGYLAQNKTNVILLDWEEEAKTGSLGLPLGYALSAVPNSKKVGEELGRAIVTLAGGGLDMNQLTLVGHSLGAHLLCDAARTARNLNYVVPRLIALDPARVLFEGPFTLHQGVDKKCAKFVTVIHTDSGGYGIKYPAGTVDIYPNFAGNKENTLQPSCPSGQFEMFTPEDLCSHDCSWRYLVESLFNRTSFVAVKANSYKDWRARNFNANETVYMGELTSSRARGVYYLTTNASSPYGKGLQGIYPDPVSTRKRRNPVLAGLGSRLSGMLRYLR